MMRASIIALAFLATACASPPPAPAVPPPSPAALACAAQGGAWINEYNSPDGAVTGSHCFVYGK